MLVCLDEPVKRSSRNFWMKLKRAHFVTAAASQTAARSSKRVHYKNVFWLLKNCFVYLRRDIVHWIKLASCSIKSLATFFANSCFLTKKTCLFILVTRLPRLHLCFTFCLMFNSTEPWRIWRVHWLSGMPSQTIGGNTFGIKIQSKPSLDLLKLVCCKKQQKSAWPVPGL